MKKVVLTYEGFKHTNIGDYIQSLAAKQFIDSEEILYHHRDELNSVEEEAKVILNGWFTHKPENWPPSPLLRPLFVAFHINTQVYKKLVSEKSIAYFKQHEPIGCRDESTAELLRKKGLDAYFSSCLTTTLGYKYRSTERNNKIYVVDAAHFIPEVQRRFQKYKFLLYYLINCNKIKPLLDGLRKNKCPVDLSPKLFDRFCGVVRTFLLLRQILSPADLQRVELLTQNHFSHELPTNQLRFQRAEELLKMYSQAALVITSRIHVALPCLGLGTPVIFLQNMDDSEESTCRFKGLIDLLNVIQFRRNSVLVSPFPLPLNIDEVRNPKRYQSYAEDLMKKCKDFMSSI